MISEQAFLNNEDENKKLEEIFQQVNIRQKQPKQRKKKDDKIATSEHVEILLKIAKLQIIGHTASHEIVFWQNGRTKVFTARQLSKYDLVLLLGPFEVNHEDIKSLIIETAWKKGIIDLDTPLRMGVWLINGKWLINTGKFALQIVNGEITPLEEPVFEGQLLEFGKKEWLDKNEFIRAFKDESVTLATVFEKVLALVKQWNWKEKTMAEYAAALVILSPLQHAMPWRPWVFILGPTYSGKTKFFECVLESIYLDLAKRVDKTTAHAFAQGIGSTGKIAVLDEQDKNPKIEQLLELLKSACRGGTKSSGTPGEKAHRFEFHHLIWLGAIYYPSTITEDAAKQSRIIKLELDPVKNRDVIRETEKDGRLAARIVATVIKNWDQISTCAKEIFTKRGIEPSPQASDRTYENFLFPSAILSLVYHFDHTIPQWAAPTVDSDEDRILRTIITSSIEVTICEKREKRLIAELLNYILNKKFSVESKEALGRVGLAIVQNAGDPYLAINSEALRRHVLKDTPYNGADVSGILKRIKGAKADVAKIGGASTRAVLIPIETLEFLLGKEEVT